LAEGMDFGRGVHGGWRVAGAVRRH
jgi:hypothetical protein